MSAVITELITELGQGPSGPEWLKKCQRRPGTTTPLSNLFNAIVAMREDPNLQDCFALDLMSRMTMLQSPLPGSAR